MIYVVLGGLGFLGSETCRQLLKEKDTERVVVFDNDSKGYGNSNIIDFMDDERFRLYKLDLHKTENNVAWNNLRDELWHADYVLNFAALIGGIGYFNKIPADILRDNNLVNSYVMDEIMAVPSHRRPHYLYMSSSMVFESAEQFPSAENDLQDTKIPKTAYGFQKLCGEFMCQAYADQYDFKYTIIRPFNAVGPERPDPDFVGYSHVIPDLILKIHQGQGTKENPLKILGDGHQVRHYTDVREIAEGLLIAMRGKASNEVFHVAIDKGHTVVEVAKLIYKYMRPNENLTIQVEEGFPHDVKYRSPNIEKMQSMFGWRASNTLEDIMPELIDNVLSLLEVNKVKT